MLIKEFENTVQSKRDIRDAKILIIENEEDYRKKIKVALEDEKFDLSRNVYITDYDQEILNKIKALNFDIIVSDYMMPNQSGITLLEDIRQINYNLILVLYTGYAISENSDESTRCLNASIAKIDKQSGFNNFIGILSLLLQENTLIDEEKGLNVQQKSILRKILTKFRPTSNQPPKEDKQEANWTEIINVYAKILKETKNIVICECLINEKEKDTQIREFPLLLFENIKPIQEGKIVAVIIRQKPGEVSTTVIEITNPEIDNLFELDSEFEKLNDFDKIINARK